MIGLTINKYKLTDKIDSNSSYDVYRGIHVNNATEVGFKVQLENFPQDLILRQVKIIKDLYDPKRMEEVLGIPSIVEAATFEDDRQNQTHSYFSFNMLGESLLDRLLRYGNGRLSLREALLCGDQLLSRLEYIHRRGYVHRNIRPENIRYGKQFKKQTIYLTNFEQAARYRTKQQMAPYKDNKKQLKGAPRYASVNSQLGIEQSPRDDLESLVYVLVYLMKGTLPWQHIRGFDKNNRIQKIMLSKIVDYEEIWVDCPPCLRKMMWEIKRCSYEDLPNYKLLRSFMETDSLEVCEVELSQIAVREVDLNKQQG